MDFRNRVVAIKGWQAVRADELTLQILAIGSESECFPIILERMDAVDNEVLKFWASR